MYQPLSRSKSFVRRLKRILWWSGFVLLFFGACLGMPIIIDPPPRDVAADSQDQTGSRRKRRRRRAA